MPAARLPCGGAAAASPSLNKYYETHMNPGSEATHIFLPFSGLNPLATVYGGHQDSTPAQEPSYQSKASLSCRLNRKRLAISQDIRQGAPTGDFFPYGFSFFFFAWCRGEVGQGSGGGLLTACDNGEFFGPQSPYPPLPAALTFIPGNNKLLAGGEKASQKVT